MGPGDDTRGLQMTDRPHRIAIALVAGFAFAFGAPLPALGASFAFSYEYADNNMLTGTFDGDVTGDNIENISNLKASYEGTSLGSLQIEHDTASFSGSTMHLEGNGFVMGLPSGFALATGEIDVVVENGVIVQPPVIPGTGLVFNPRHWSVLRSVPSLTGWGIAALGALLLAVGRWQIGLGEETAPRGRSEPRSAR